MSEPAKRYKVAEIALGEDGTWWLNWIGVHPDQGGLSYRWGAVGLKSPEDLAGYVDTVMTAEQAEYLKQIEKKKSTPSGS